MRYRADCAAAHMPYHQCQKLAPAGQGIAPTWAIQLRRQSIEFKSRHTLENLYAFHLWPFETTLLFKERASTKM